MRLMERSNGKVFREVETRIDIDEYHRLPLKSGVLENHLRRLEYQLVNPNQPECKCGCGGKGKP